MNCLQFLNSESLEIFFFLINVLSARLFAYCGCLSKSLEIMHMWITLQVVLFSCILITVITTENL